MYSLIFALVYYNDLWSFNSSSSQWILITGGSQKLGVYGTKMVPNDSNCPGGRIGHAMSLDSTSQLLYAFGGYGYVNSLTAGK